MDIVVDILQMAHELLMFLIAPFINDDDDYPPTGGVGNPIGTSQAFNPA